MRSASTAADHRRVPRLVSRHAVPALLVVLAALLVPVLDARPSGYVVVNGDESVSVTYASATDAELPAGDVAFPIGSEGLAKAQEIAGQYWGALACNGQVELAWTKMDPQTNATASWKNP